MIKFQNKKLFKHKTNRNMLRKNQNNISILMIPILFLNNQNSNNKNLMRMSWIKLNLKIWRQNIKKLKIKCKLINQMLIKKLTNNKILIKDIQARIKK